MSLLRPAVALILVLCLCSIVQSDTHTAIASGKWLADAATVWNTKDAPINGDTVVIPNTFDVEFDEDMSGWANGVILTINTGGTLHAILTANSYLKLAGTMTVNGTHRAGTSVAVPFPIAYTHTIFSTGNFGITVGAGGKQYLYCVEPTYQYVKLSGAEAAGQTELSVDTNVTGDIWADGNEILICDVYPATLPEVESRVIAAGGIAANTITVTVGLTAEKKIGAFIVLVKRNVRILVASTTNVYAINMNAATTGCDIYAEINGSGTGYRGVNNGTVCTFGGCVARCNYGFYAGTSHTNTGTIVGCFYGFSWSVFNTNTGTISGCNYGFSWGTSPINAGTISGCTYGLYQGISNTNTGTINGCTYGFWYGTSSTNTGTVSGCYCGFYAGVSPINTGTISGCDYGFREGDNFYIMNCTLNNTSELHRVFSGIAYNVIFTGIEFYDYNNSNYRDRKSYFQSLNHDGVEKAYKAWCLGGIVSSQTVSPPSGYSIWYQHACESATYPCFRQYQVTLKPDETLNVEALIRLYAGDDHTTYPPRLQIIDYFADPLIDASNDPLDEDQVTEPNGTVNNDWQEVVCSYVNQGDSDKIVLVRIIAKHATADVDEVWSLPDYKIQVQAIYDKLPTNYIMGSSVVADKDDEIDAILVDTGTTIPGTITTIDNEIAVIDGIVDDILIDTGTTIPAAIDANFVALKVAMDANFAAIDIDEGAIADEVVLHMDANSTQLAAIVADTNELQTDWADGGRLDLLIDGIKAMTDLISIVNTTVAEANDANDFIITAGIDVNDAYNGMHILVQDSDDNHYEIRRIYNWDSTREVYVDEPFGFIPAKGDVVHIIGVSYGGLLDEMYDLIARLPRGTYVYKYDGTPTGAAAVTRYDAIGADP